MMNKRGQETVQSHLIDIIAIAFLVFALVYFVAGTAKGDAIKEQVISKKISLILDSALPNTKIIFDTSKINMDINNNQVITKIKKQEKGYDYGFYNSYKINIAKEQNQTIAEVSEK